MELSELTYDQLEVLESALDSEQDYRAKEQAWAKWHTACALLKQVETELCSREARRKAA